MELLFISLLFLLGKLFSLFIYHVCWSSHQGEKWVYILWLPLVALIIFLSTQNWENLPLTRVYVTVAAIQLAVAAVGRFNPARSAYLFSIVTIALSIMVYWHPLWLACSLLCSCLLQYRIASWSLSPGYSNLLGFEFSRSSLCSTLGILSFSWFIFPTTADALILSLLVLHQASYYINHGLAKNAIGNTPFEWIQHNRIQHLIGNAWLRGWTMGIKKETCLSVFRVVAKHRVLICWAAWLIEVLWLFAFLHHSIPLFLYPIAVCFHLLVFIFTGLSCWHFVINHICLFVLLSHLSTSIASLEALITAIVTCLLTGLWVGIVRLKVFNAHRSKKHHSHWHKLADASDHLMAWWDSPLMRMYSFTVETTSGKQYSFPVTKISPYDTILTDIHTHMMVLDLHHEFDLDIEEDKQVARTGVWGLLADKEDRDKLYASETLPVHHSKTKPWSIDITHRHSASPLIEHFEAINRNLFHPLSKWRLKWPHFPGEDHAPDISPLVPEKLPQYTFNEKIKLVRILRIKTWSQNEDFTLLDHSLCGEIHLQSNNE